ncbi:MAG: type II toxin-antitoxin system death-on-curing family toxin [Rhodoluna sp.]|nr:type II toxin-antitoxin system death-on-curing family toxin [Rhodoluna sp.]
MTQYLSLQDSLTLVKAMGFHLQDAGLLEAALARPKTSISGEDAYATLSLKAAALLESVIKNHALIDGNKRIGWLLMVSFLFINGYQHNMGTDVSFDLAIGVAEGRYELRQASQIIEKHLVLRPIA